MIYDPAFADQARDMCRLGATDEELAEHFAVCVRTIYRWRNSHEAFAKAVVIGKDYADARVERALYSRAVGCTVERTRVFRHGDADPVYATYREHLPPDANAALHWLRVRQPEKWRIRDEPEEDTGWGKIIEEAFARVGKSDRLDEAARLAEPPPPPPPPPPAPPPPPPPPPQAAAPDPDPAPAPDLDMRPDDDPASEPSLYPDEGPRPASPAGPAPPPPAPPPRPPLFERFSRPGGGYGPRPPDGG
ncbi:MAG: terminase [Sphingomonas bacterium]|uniref:hypothetical protein n=1 Tax=Sphingomonas bacterium TaxID=1895847 RepID=UPI002611AC2E|nr:hypothetical protein [Sphingomonas bacterium]MDB5703434.1 terminase [Sphingomonas bacterium]